MQDSHQRKRRREYDAETVVCRHCETPRTRREERRHLKQRKLAERQGRDTLGHIDIEVGNSTHSEPAPNVPDMELHAETADTILSTMEHDLVMLYHIQQLYHVNLDPSSRRRRLASGRRDHFDESCAQSVGDEQEQDN
ncbi:hypothetical protein RSOL_103100, partial [Rhizoctonia solani AG-3 Rhs1AP]